MTGAMTFHKLDDSSSQHFINVTIHIKHKESTGSSAIGNKSKITSCYKFSKVFYLYQFTYWDNWKCFFSKDYVYIETRKMSWLECISCWFMSQDSINPRLVELRHSNWRHVLYSWIIIFEAICPFCNCPYV